MPARIVLVHMDRSFLRSVSATLRADGLDVAAFSDAMRALNALEAARSVDLLITSLDTEPTGPNGRSLALMTRRRRPDLKVIFTGQPGLADLVTDLGTFLPEPVSPARLMVETRQVLNLLG